MSLFIQSLTLFLISTITIVYGTDPLLFSEDILKDSHGSIIYSSVVFRHGDRAPRSYDHYPTDPYKKEFYWKTYWPQGKGQLSKKGKLQVYNLGKWCHKRYNSLINKGYRHNFLQVHSSDCDRTIMSAECFLAGFFPPSPNEFWADDGLNWQPVPVRAIPAKLDALIGLGIKCPKYEEEQDILKNSSEMKEYYNKYEKVFHYIEAHSGLNMSSADIPETILNAFFLNNLLFIEKSYNLTLPKWTESVYPEPLQSMAAFSLSLWAYSHKMRRITAGSLIGKMIEEMELKVQGKLDETFHFYSGHETTVSGLLTALEIFNYIVPPVSSSVFIELRRKKEDYVVTILYRNSTASAPYLLQLPGCEYVCKLENFKKLTENLIPKNWQDECNKNNKERKRTAQKEQGMEKWPSEDF